MEKYLKECFVDFSPSMIMDLASISSVLTYKAEEIIFYEGDKSHKMHIVTEGKISIYKTNAKNEKQVLRYFTPVALFAELANIQKIPFPASAKAEETSKIILIDFEKFEKYFFGSSTSSSIVYGSMMDSLASKLSYHVCQSCFNPMIDTSVNGKLAKVLISDLDSFNKSKKWKIAQDLRIAPETLSRSIKRFKELGLIETQRGKVVISKMDELIELSKD